VYSEIFTDVSTILQEMGKCHGEGVFLGQWTDKHWLNTPGPVYCGATDNCGTGPFAAPNNVHIDAEGYEFVFRQPVNRYEVRQVLLAADHDPFSGYGAGGDVHWTYEAIKEWWRGRRDMEAELAKEYKEQLALGDRKNYLYFAGLSRWRDYLEDGMETYLRVYAFFLLEGRPPTAADRLPDVSL
jgi:hypothetical protein